MKDGLFHKDRQKGPANGHSAGRPREDGRNGRVTRQFIERMAVETDGSGEAVLMIHGLGGTSNVWTPVLPAMGHHRTIRPDLPGSGRSHRVEGPLSIERFVQAMQRVCAGLGLEPLPRAPPSLGPIVPFHMAIPAP